MRKWLVPILTIFGGGLGFAYYYFIGCATGGCPLTSHPVSSTIYGGIIGGLAALIFADGKKQNT